MAVSLSLRRPRRSETSPTPHMTEASASFNKVLDASLAFVQVSRITSRGTSQMMTTTQFIALGKSRHARNRSWLTAFAAELGLSYWQAYRATTKGVPELIEMKVEKLLREERA